MKKTITADDLPYRLCVGIMVLNSQGLVWAGRRIKIPNGEMEGATLMWQMPQGGIDAGEDPAAASLRELYEETGMRTVTLLGESPGWINYDLPTHLMGTAFKGKYRGQSQKWFAYRFHGNENEIAINPPPGGHTPEFDAWEWKRLDELPDLIVPFKRHVYEQVIATFRHLGS